MCVCLLPFALMRAHLHEAWGYATLVSLSTLAAARTAYRARTPTLFAAHHLVVFAASAVACACATILFVVAMGTTWRGCLNGLVLQYWSFGTDFHALPQVGVPRVGLGVLATGIALCCGELGRHRQPEPGSQPGRVLPLARLALGVGTVAIAMLWPDRLHGHAIYLALPWLWLVLPTPQEWQRCAGGSFLRIAACFLGVLLALQSYPVHGSQADATWAFMLPALGLCAYDGWTGLAQRGILHPSLARIAPQFCMLGMCVAGLFALWGARGTYRSLTPLLLPGARWVRTPEPDAGALRALAEALPKRFDTFITMPGMNSLYLWTRLSPPTTVTTGPWIVTVSPEAQQQLVDRFDGVGSLGVVRSMELVALWTHWRPVPRRPLVQWIEREFTPVARVGRYEILARQGRPVRESDDGHE
jgi:hypothetical protein